MTAGADTAIGALIEAAGAINVGREMGVSGIAPAGAERAFVADPDVVLVGTWPGRRGGDRSTRCSRRLRAVREGRIVALPTSCWSRFASTPRTPAGTWPIALHPDRVPSAARGPAMRAARQLP